MQKLLEIFAAEEQNVNRERAAGLSAETKLAITVWTLANQETCRQTSDRFGLSRGYVHYVFKQGCTIVHTLASLHALIKWPSSVEIEKMVQCYPFPGGFAAVDGSHVAIKTPLSHSDSYINRKSFASVVLQGVCCLDLQFIDVSTGWPGSMHDARI